MRFKLKKNSHTVDLLFTLALFCVFTASALIVVLIGANVYKGTAENMLDAFSSRTVMSYITEKVRQNDVADAISIKTINGQNALAIKNTTENGTFFTYIYCYDGWMYELFTKDSVTPGLGMGQKLLQASDINFFSDYTGLLTIQATDENGTESTLSLALQCK